MAQKLDNIESIEQKREISSYVKLMAGLKYDKDSVRRIFREGIMRESVIYQEILQEGEARGEARGRRVLQREMVLGMLSEGISIETIARLTQLSISEIQQIQLKPQ